MRGLATRAFGCRVVAAITIDRARAMACSSSPILTVAPLCMKQVAWMALVGHILENGHKLKTYLFENFS